MISQRLLRRLKRIEDMLRTRYEPEVTASDTRLIRRLDEARRRMAKINGEEYVSICPELETETEAQTPGQRMIEMLMAGRQRWREEELKRQRADCSDGPIEQNDNGSPIAVIETSGEC
jgi:hypothetical protein